MFHCHYTCDVCHRVLDPGQDARYRLRISLCPNLDEEDGKIDEDRDYLEEINDSLECGAALDGIPDDEALREPVEYDLCSDCRRRFSLEPWGTRGVPVLEFSEN